MERDTQSVTDREKLCRHGLYWLPVGPTPITLFAGGRLFGNTAANSIAKSDMLIARV